MASLAKKLPRKGPSTDGQGFFVPQELWPLVRQLTPAEGLALVSLTSWVQDETGVARASDRQVCNQTGVSRDVMKRLRRKLAALGIGVTPGDHLSHESCAYDLRTVLQPEGRWRPRPLPGRVARPSKGRGPVQETARLGAKGTEAPGAKSAHPWAQTTPLVEVHVSVDADDSSQRARFGRGDGQRAGARGAPGGEPAAGTIAAAGEPGATPLWEVACDPTAPVLEADFLFAADLPSEPIVPATHDDLKRAVEIRRAQLGLAARPPAQPPLGPYEQWLARR